MTKGVDYFESTGEAGGPIVLVPGSLVHTITLDDETLTEIALADKGPDDQIDESAEANAAYEKICEGNDWLRVVPFFEDGLALRMGEGRGNVYWIPRPDGALAVQWQGADSEEQLLAAALENAGASSWEEELIFEAVEDRFYLAESPCLLWGSVADTPLCEVSLPRGKYRVTAQWVEEEALTAIVFRFVRQE